MRGKPPRIWCTQDASLVSEAMGIDPQVLLKNLEGATRPEFEIHVLGRKAAVFAHFFVVILCNHMGYARES